MGSVEHLSLRWNEYESTFKQGFSDLRQNGELFDVTLMSGSKQIKAHKVILSTCSPVFRSIIGSTPSVVHPLIYLRGINFDHLELLLSFMYSGEVRVIQEELEDFISFADELQIKGFSNKSPSPKQLTPQPIPSRASNSTNLTPSQNTSNTAQKDTRNEPEPMETINNSAIDISMDKNKEYILALDEEIRLHIKRLSSRSGYKCKKCRYSTTKVNLINNHIEDKHIITRGFKCSICDTKFNTRHFLSIHTSKTHFSEKFVISGPEDVQ